MSNDGLDLARSTLARRRDRGTTPGGSRSTSLARTDAVQVVRPAERVRLSNRSRFGASLAILGIIDPDEDRARAQIAAKNDALVPGYAAAAVWPTPEAAGLALAATHPAGDGSGIDLVVVGAPPQYRGGIHPPADLDLRLMAALPQARRWLVEKPISAAPPTDRNGQERVSQAYRDTGAIVGAGYMMCALKGVQMIQDMITAKGLRVMGTAARVSPVTWTLDSHPRFAY